MRSVVVWQETPVRAGARLCRGGVLMCVTPVLTPCLCAACLTPAQPEKDGVRSVCYDACFKPGVCAVCAVCVCVGGGGGGPWS
jgi:hypothetical protein